MCVPPSLRPTTQTELQPGPGRTNAPAGADGGAFFRQMPSSHWLYLSCALLAVACVSSFSISNHGSRLTARNVKTARNVVCSLQHDSANVCAWSRRNLLAAAFVGITMPVNAEEILKIPESERIKPPAGKVLGICFYMILPRLLSSVRCFASEK